MDFKKKSLQGSISSEMNAGRILFHGKVDSLETNFALPGNVPFSIFIVPKSYEITFGIAEILSVKLYQEDELSNCPFVVGAWNEPSIVEIEAHANAVAELNEAYGIYADAKGKLEMLKCLRDDFVWVIK